MPTSTSLCDICCPTPTSGGSSSGVSSSGNPTVACCCTFPVPENLTVTITAPGCACLNGLTFPLVFQGDSGGQCNWQGDKTVTTCLQNPCDVLVIFSCADGIPFPTLGWAATIGCSGATIGNVGDSSSSCSPFVAVIKITDTGLAGLCAGGTVITLTITG